MFTSVSEFTDAPADRLPILHTAGRSTCRFGDVVREDLDNLAAQVSTAIRHCDELSLSAPALRSLDMQRDVLHLQARIGSLARQIADASDALERIQRRTATDPLLRRQLRLPLP